MRVLFMLSSVFVTQESMNIENRMLELPAFNNLLVVVWGTSACRLFSHKYSFSFSVTFSQTKNLNLSKGRLRQDYLWCMCLVIGI